LMDRVLADTRWQFARYVANGTAATLVHYGVLVLLLDVAGFRSAGAANLVAAIVGITFSFMGSRYFVFDARHGEWRHQFRRFVVVYSTLALVHASVLLFWTDQFGYDFRIGFVLATGLQVMISFIANRFLVFAP
jgi:putative flippase GtrA